MKCYPMTFDSVISVSDLPRLARDTMDDEQIGKWAEAFGCSIEQARAGFRRFFGSLTSVALAQW